MKVLCIASQTKEENIEPLTETESKKTEVRKRQGTEYAVVSAAVPGDRAVDQRSGFVDGWDGAGSLDGEGE